MHKMKISEEKLKDLLVAPGHISDVDFNNAVKEGGDLEEVLVGKDLIKDEQLGQLVAEDAGYRFIDLLKEKINEEVLMLIPELVASSKGIIAYSRVEGGINVGMRDPNDKEMIHLIEKRVGEKVIPHYITQKGLLESLSKYKAGLKDEFNKMFKKLSDKTLSREQKDDITVGTVDTLMSYGYENKASDIHVEPFKEKVVVRFRIDGVMHDVLDIPKKLENLILTRIKILAKMRTDEHRAAQDGKFRFSADTEDVDVRVSVVPVTEGENIVMRLLSSNVRQFTLSLLGFADSDLRKVKNAAKKPHGMILVTGPTGSGKTTTIYAVLKILNKRESHISTIEDPVEYDVEGISQIQVNTKTNLTFAKGLRAIVRQDPDIIMVGEIRDEETAGIAINSAMTGHLVLSTLHANDSATTLPRLLDMGIEPFLVASTVNIVIAQRLVRKICEKCRASYTLTEKEKNMLKNEPEVQKILEARGHKNLDNIMLYTGEGCKVCGDTGYSGRIGIFEVLEMDENIKDLIVARAQSDDIVKSARANGMTTMLEDGIGKVLSGVTTLEEVMKATKA